VPGEGRGVNWKEHFRREWKGGREDTERDSAIAGGWGGERRGQSDVNKRGKKGGTRKGKEEGGRWKFEKRGWRQHSKWNEKKRMGEEKKVNAFHSKKREFDGGGGA